MKINNLISLICIILLITLSIFGCAKSNNVNINDYQNQKTIGSQICIIQDGCYTSLIMFDTILFLINECDSNYVHLYSINNLEKLNSFGRKGKAPDEMLLPSFIQNSFRNINNSTLFSIYDLNNNKISEYNLEDVLNFNCFPQKTQFVNPNIVNSNEMCITENKTLIGNKLSDGKGLFYIFNNEKIEWIDFWPKCRLRKNSSRNSMMYNCIIRINKNRIVLAYVYYNRIAVYNLNGKKNNDVSIGEPVFPDFSSNTEFLIPQNALTFFTDMYVTDSYIYCLYNEILQKDFGNSNSINNSKVLKLDWDLNIKQIYNLDMLIYRFTVDEKSGIIYGLTINEFGFTPLLKYKI